MRPRSLADRNRQAYSQRKRARICQKGLRIDLTDMFGRDLPIMSVLEKLKTDPLQYVANLDSPVGIYLRREIFKKEIASDALLKEVYEKIIAEQTEDGSWGQLFVRTANNLWNLALLGIGAEDPSVKMGLRWLLSIQKEEYRGHPGFFNLRNRKDPSIMRTTYYGEFGPGCTIFYQTAYAIHLLHLFGFDDNEQVKTTIDSYLQFWEPTWCGAWVISTC